MSVSHDVGCVDHICLWNGGSQGLVGGRAVRCMWRGVCMEGRGVCVEGSEGVCREEYVWRGRE